MNIVAETKRLAESVAFNLRVHGFEDRKYLREVMLPAMAEAKPSNVMLAGTRRYNVGYPKLLDQQSTAVWTLDFDPRAARFGNGYLHRTCDIREIDRVFSGIRFDVVHINGLLGFGINTDDDIKLMIEAVHRTLVPGGYMMLGWDADATEDPLSNPDVLASFHHAGLAPLPARYSVVGCSGHDHVFDWFRRLNE